MAQSCQICNKKNPQKCVPKTGEGVFHQKMEHVPSLKSNQITGFFWQFKSNQIKLLAYLYEFKSNQETIFVKSNQIMDRIS